MVEQIYSPSKPVLAPRAALESLRNRTLASIAGWTSSWTRVRAGTFGRPLDAPAASADAHRAPLEVDPAAVAMDFAARLRRVAKWSEVRNEPIYLPDLLHAAVGDYAGQGSTPRSVGAGGEADLTGTVLGDREQFRGLIGAALGVARGMADDAPWTTALSRRGGSICLTIEVGLPQQRCGEVRGVLVPASRLGPTEAGERGEPEIYRGIGLGLAALESLAVSSGITVASGRGYVKGIRLEICCREADTAAVASHQSLMDHIRSGNGAVVVESEALQVELV